MNTIDFKMTKNEALLLLNLLEWEEKTHPLEPDLENLRERIKLSLM